MATITGYTKAQTDTLLAAKASALVGINSQTGTAYTPVLGDAGRLIRLENGAAITFTVPPNSAVAYPVGTEIALSQAGAGVVTIAPGSGVTLNSRGGALKTAGQHAPASLLKVATDTWLVTGDLTA